MMKLRMLGWIGVLSVCLLARAGLAQGPRGGVGVRAVLDRAPLVVGGEATIAVQIDVPKGLHIQGAMPHDKDLEATVVTVKPMEGLSFGAVRYPEAKEIPTPAGLSTAPTLAVYEGTVYVLVPVKVAGSWESFKGWPTEETGGVAAVIELSVRTQACNEKSCFPPVTQSLKVAVDVGGAGAKSTMQEEGLFAAARGQKSAEVVNASPETASATTATAPADEDEMAAVERGNYVAANAGDEARPVWMLLLFALVGGAILNIMPCVLPVIPLKVMSLIHQAHGERRASIAHALVFAAGIVTLFVLLGVALGTYGAATGTAVVYGKQFQSVTFLLVMAMIVLALALSMLGVWTINPPAAVYSLDQQRTGYFGSFMSGMLATLLATPCSAPFLGGVLAWAFGQPLVVAVAVLGLVGVGMAVPYVVLAAFPAGLERLPRSGRWSELVKQFLGMVMIGVALYLVTTIPDPGLWPWAVFSGLVVAGMCWAWGQIPSVDWEPARVWTVRVATLVVGTVVIFGMHRFLVAEASGEGYRSVGVSEAGGLLPWERFNMKALDRGLKEKRVVVVDWTANWCINCRVVEATVLHSAAVQKEFREKHVLLLKADITAGNPVAEKMLEKLGGRSIPFLAIFSPEKPTRPVVLRDWYSRERVMGEVERGGRE